MFLRLRVRGLGSIKLRIQGMDVFFATLGAASVSLQVQATKELCVRD